MGDYTGKKRIEISKETVAVFLCYCLVYFGNVKLFFPQLGTIAEILQIVMLFASVLYVVKYKLRPYISISINIVLFSFFYLMYFCLAFLSDNSVGLKTNISSSLINLVFIVLILFLSQGIEFEKYLLFSVVSNWVMICLYMLLNLGLIMSYIIKARRIESLELPNPIWVARFAGDIFLLSWMYYFYKKDAKSRKLLFVILIPILIMLVVTGSKGVIAALFGTLLYFHMTKSINKRNKIRAFAGILAVVILMFVIVHFWGISRLAGYFRFDTIMDRRQGARLDRYIYAFNHISENLMMGHGVGSWGRYFLNKDIYDYPHNILLEIIFECGVITLAVFIIMFIGLFISEKKNRTYEVHILISLTLFYLINAMFSGGLMTGNKNVFVYYCLVSSFLELNRKRKSNCLRNNCS